VTVLLGRAHGFEGFIPTRERANVPKRSIMEARNHEPKPLTDLRSRVPDTPGHVNKRNNAILRVADVADLKAEAIEVLREGRLEPSHAVMSTVRGALEPALSRVPDAIGSVEGQRSIDSFRAKGLEGVSHDLHVLLRNAPSPALRPSLAHFIPRV
jgi:hypothetical protein